MLPFLARPLYNGCGAHYLSEKAFWSGQSTRAMPILTGQVVSSLLPDAFNSLMCHALNFIEDGQRATHFVMLHGDIAPQEGWLTILLDEMEETGVDVLSAVVPIKSIELDTTSTAVGKLDGRYSKFRRISTEESMLLPKTFFPGDVCAFGEKLLLNTGLLGIDLRKPWVTEWFASGGFRFETHAWQENGEWTSMCLPEDWLFSWDAQTKYGAKVAATTKIRLLHFGDLGFENRRPIIKAVAA